MESFRVWKEKLTKSALNLTISKRISSGFLKRKGRGDRGDYFPSIDLAREGKGRPDFGKRSAACGAARSGRRLKTTDRWAPPVSGTERERREGRRTGSNGPGTSRPRRGRERDLGRLSA
ncbi:hypothetical protein [Oryza sativa Japonica Group]|uniref:Uncharacterized protein n=1 Tax=Oryza sativa subsp. japonica TaxID=39947 RepID=Q5Z8F4_ORYSJ|nr:hypothetical protein [Oryza sativa Japonica Group]